MKHFEKWPISWTKGLYRTFIFDGYEGNVNAEFGAYCKGNNTVTLYLAPYSYHLTQNLDVSYFNVLKLRYGGQLNVFIKGHINHIAKVKFLQASDQDFFATITPENIRGSFRGTGIVLLTV